MTPEHDALVERLLKPDFWNEGYRKQAPYYCAHLKEADAPVKAAQAIAALSAEVARLKCDKDRLDYLQDESNDLCSFDIPTGGGDADIGWKVVAHFMAKPCQRVVAEVWHDDLRAAIDAAALKERSDV